MPILSYEYFVRFVCTSRISVACVVYIYPVVCSVQLSHRAIQSNGEEANKSLRYKTAPENKIHNKENNNRDSSGLRSSCLPAAETQSIGHIGDTQTSQPARQTTRIYSYEAIYDTSWSFVCIMILLHPYAYVCSTRQTAVWNTKHQTPNTEHFE